MTDRQATLLLTQRDIALGGEIVRRAVRRSLGRRLTLFTP